MNKSDNLFKQQKVQEDPEILKDEFIELGNSDEQSFILEGQSDPLPPLRVILTVVIMSFNLFLQMANNSGIVVATSTIGSTLNAGNSVLWAGTSTLVANSVAQGISGRLSDVFGRKSVLLTMLIILLISDLVCAFVKTPTQYFVFRGFNGFLAGGIHATTVVILSDIVGMQSRSRCQGYYGFMINAGKAAGPFIMSAFVQAGDWQDFYYLMPGLVLVQLVLTAWILNDNEKRYGQKYSKKSQLSRLKLVDYSGLFLLTVGLVLFLISINGGGIKFKWNSPICIAFLVVGVSLLIIFVLNEWKLAKLPIIPLHLFKDFSLDLILFADIFFGISVHSFEYFMPYYFQVVKKYDSNQSSIHLLSYSLGMAVFSIIAGEIICRMKRSKLVIIIGFIFWIIGTGCLETLSLTSNSGQIVGILLVIGIGGGLTVQATVIAAQCRCIKSDRAVTISMKSITSSIGGAIGNSIGASIVGNTLLHRISEAETNGSTIPAHYWAYLRQHIYSKFKTLDLTAEQADFVRKMYLECLRDYFHFLVAVIAVCLLCYIFVEDKGLKHLDEQTQ